jgi:hypothetical protein
MAGHAQLLLMREEQPGFHPGYESSIKGLGASRAKVRQGAHDLEKRSLRL